MPLGDGSSLTVQSVLVVQWLLLSALAILVFVAYRQLAFFTKLARSASADGGLALGSMTMPIDYRPLGSKQVRRIEFRGASTFMIFANPGCPACERMIPLLAEVARVPGFGAATYLFSIANDDTINGDPAFRAADIPIGIVDRYVLEQFRVRFVPYAYLVGPGGEVLARGAIDGEDQLKSLLKPLKRAEANFVGPGVHVDNRVLEEIK